MIYQFDDFDIDIEQFEIRQLGQPLSVEPKVFDLIVYLLQARGRIVSRYELFQKIWAGREVSDTTLSNHVKTARKLLGDNGDSQRVIKTIRSRGYQFIAEVIEVQEQALMEPVPQHTSLAEPTGHHAVVSKRLQTKLFVYVLGILLVLLAGYFMVDASKEVKQLDKAAPYILVVPFSVSSQDTIAWQPFADQMTRELIQTLRKISSVKVVPPPSAFAFKGNKKRSHIQNQLPEATYVLDGVVSEGEQGNIRITVELENLKSNQLVWDGDFDIRVDSENRFHIQAQIASSVSTSLQVVVLDDEKKQLAKVPTSSLPAYDLYVQGQSLMSKMTRDSVRQSIDYFKQAIDLDPQFEAAYVAKSNAYRILMIFFDMPKDVLPQVISSAIDVITLSSESAQARSSLGLAYVHTWLWDDAWKMLVEAKERDQNLVLTELGFALYYSAMGDINGVKQALIKADALDPLNEELAEWGMWALMMTGEIDATLEWGEKKLALHPNKPYPLLSMAIAEYINGNFERSIHFAKQGVALSERAPYPLITLAQSYAAAGQFDKVLPLINEAQAQTDYTCPYETATVYALMEQPDVAFKLLDQAVEYRSNCLIFTRHDPRFDMLRSDPRYELLLTKIGLTDEAVFRYRK